MHLPVPLPSVSCRVSPFLVRAVFDVPRAEASSAILPLPRPVESHATERPTFRSNRNKRRSLAARYWPERLQGQDRRGGNRLEIQRVVVPYFVGPTRSRGDQLFPRVTVSMLRPVPLCSSRLQGLFL